MALLLLIALQSGGPKEMLKAWQGFPSEDDAVRIKVHRGRAGVVRVEVVNRAKTEQLFCVEDVTWLHAAPDGTQTSGGWGASSPHGAACDGPADWHRIKAGGSRFISGPMGPFDPKGAVRIVAAIWHGPGSDKKVAKDGSYSWAGWAKEIS